MKNLMMKFELLIFRPIGKAFPPEPSCAMTSALVVHFQKPLGSVHARDQEVAPVKTHCVGDLSVEAESV